MEMPKPDPAWKRFEKLIGKWELKGRSLDSKEDNITGWSTFEWILDGFFLKMTSEINFNGMTIHSVEIVAYDLDKKTFPANVYSNMSGGVLSYGMDMKNNEFTHTGLGATYKGTLSEDGNTLKGGWRPDKGIPSTAANTYDADMIRIK